MEKYAVIGLGFGDEGKGKTVDYLCEQALERGDSPIVCRFSGGQQAGHTVHRDGVQHVFSNFGSGTLLEVPTFWDKHCTFDPVGAMVEYDLLRKKGYFPELAIHEDCPITTPFDKWAQQSDQENLEHGTCGTGFGTTLQRQEDHFSLTAKDLLSDKSVLDIKLRLIAEEYYKYYDYDRTTNLRCQIKEFYDSIQEVLVLFNITSKSVEEWAESRFRCNLIIYEGSQGLLLDKNIGFFPHVTRSNTDCTNIEGELSRLYLITRAYTTRHGNGPMGPIMEHKGYSNPFESNELNEYQGSFRSCSLNLDLLSYAIISAKFRNLQTTRHLVINCMDIVEDSWKFVYKKKLEECRSAAEFTDRISSIIDPTAKVLVSNDPTADSIERKS